MSALGLYPSQQPRHDAALVSASTKSGLTQLSSRSGGPALFGGDGLDFGDIIDAVNPLQQLPVVGQVYRAVSGDGISTAATLAGGLLFGGPAGLIASAASEVFSAITGGSIGEHLVAMFNGGGTASSTQYAAAQYQKVHWLS